MSLISYALNTKLYNRQPSSQEEIIIKIQATERQDQSEISTKISEIAAELKVETKISREESHEVKILFPREF